jgi:hypothetical protein
MSSSPHDGIFKATFSDPKHMAGEIRSTLPEAFVSRINFKTLTLCPKSFVEENLKERFTDLLFSARLTGGRVAFFYILCEHQSRSDRLMPFRLLGYMVRAWDDYLRDHPRSRRLPVIVPLVVHHSEEGWTAPTAFEELMDMDPDMLDALGHYLVRFRFRLDDISFVPNAEIQSRAMSPLSKVILWFLRDGRKPRWFMKDMRSWKALLGEATRGPKNDAAVRRIVQYVLDTHDKEAADKLVARLVTAMGEERRKDVMTAADALREEGERRLFLRQLTARFGALPKSIIALVNAADTARIELWGERILTAKSLNEVLHQP